MVQARTFTERTITLNSNAMNVNQEMSGRRSTEGKFEFIFQVYGQVTLTFRYGREDEEVMGLKFCNEAVMCLAQLYPAHEKSTPETPTPLQVSKKLKERESKWMWRVGTNNLGRSHFPGQF